MHSQNKGKHVLANSIFEIFLGVGGGGRACPEPPGEVTQPTATLYAVENLILWQQINFQRELWGYHWDVGTGRYLIFIRCGRVLVKERVSESILNNFNIFQTSANSQLSGRMEFPV